VGIFSIFRTWLRVNNEQFLKEAAWLDNLKLRMSYGFTGNQENLLPYPYQLLYGPVGPYLYNGQFQQAYGIVQQPNPDLKWEQRNSLDFGLDFAIWKDRLSGTIDVYHDKTSNIIYSYDLPQPPFLYNTVNANAADAVNEGVEITVNAGIIRNQNFRWDISMNLTTLKNYVTNLSGAFQDTAISLSATEQHYGYASSGVMVHISASCR
jgi:iron complex outermembrane receptor protein